MKNKNKDIFIVEKQVDPETGFVYEEYHFKNNNFHRTDGPAKIIKNPDNGYVSQEWFIDGIRHRDGDKPAITNHFEPCGEITIQRFFKYGNEIFPENTFEIS